ncbi:MAG: cation:proton antiporter [Myxococcales bacterium]|nr:cation:proton antiporter [Myxococcales bacterium]
MHEQLLTQLALVLILGVTAQWIAWRLKLPAILLLFVFGFVAGPIVGLIDPDRLLGDLLLPIVSLSVAIILFEGGLSLRLEELRRVGKAVRNLLTMGAAITFVLTAGFTHLIFGYGVGLSLLLGAILVVTGPTVIGPLLRQLRLSERASATLKWEGILIDPLGAILALIVYEGIVGASTGVSIGTAGLGLLRSVGVGVGFGAFCGWGLGFLLRRYYLPEHLHNPITLMVVGAVFVGSNELQAEAGLLSVTVMGMVLVNMKGLSVKGIIEFKENLRTLLISTLFIILAARLKLEIVMAMGAREFIFLGALVFVVRPLSAIVALVGTELAWRERLMLAWMAPRGIVAAAVAAVFALRLGDLNIPGADRIISIVFFTIIGTIAVYGLTGPLVSRLLGVVMTKAQGALIVGAQPFARAIGTALQEEGLHVLLVDTNRENVRAARMSGLRAVDGNILGEQITRQLDLDGIGRLLALTPNEGVNSVAALRFAEQFGKEHVYQVSPMEERRGDDRPMHLRGRLLFGPRMHAERLQHRYTEGARVKKTRLSEVFTFEDYQRIHGASALPMFTVDEEGTLSVFTADSTISPKPGDTIISLADPDDPNEDPRRSPGA